jgi:hypothetical protein
MPTGAAGQHCIVRVRDPSGRRASRLVSPPETKGLRDQSGHAVHTTSSDEPAAHSTCRHRGS